MNKLIIATTLLLSASAPAAENSLDTPLHAGDTIAGMTVTQASIDDVDTMMSELKQPETLSAFTTMQSSIMFNVFGKYCERHKPELALEVRESVDEWTTEINPKLEQMFAKHIDTEARIDEAEQEELMLFLRNLSILLYLDTEQKTDPDVYCPALIEQLDINNAEIFLESTEKSYLGYIDKAEQRESSELSE